MPKSVVVGPEATTAVPAGERFLTCSNHKNEVKFHFLPIVTHQVIHKFKKNHTYVPIEHCSRKKEGQHYGITLNLERVN